MRQLLFIFIFCISCLAHGQSDNGVPIDSFREFLRKYYDGVEFSTSKLIDSLQSAHLPDWKIYLYSDYYFSDNHFKSIIDSMNLLGYTKVDYYSPLSMRIQSYISSEKNWGKKNNLAVNFMLHFTPTRDTEIFNDLTGSLGKKILSDRGEFLEKLHNGDFSSIIQGGESIEAEGDFFAHIKSLENSLIFYLLSEVAYDSVKAFDKMGKVERKIAALYENFGHGVYSSKVTEHYDSSASYFFRAGLPTEGYSSLTASLRQLIWNDMPSVHMDDVTNELVSNGFDFIRAYNDVSQGMSEGKESYILECISDLFDQIADSGDCSSGFNWNYIMANYFMQKNENEVGKKYCEAALRAAFCTSGRADDKFHTGRVVEALYMLAWVSASLGNEGDLTKYINAAANINEKQQNYIGSIYSVIVRGQCSLMLGKNKQAVDEFMNASYMIEKCSELQDVLSFPTMEVYRELSNAYLNLNKLDSSDKYSNLYYRIKSGWDKEASDMLNTEKEYYLENVRIKTNNIRNEIKSVRDEETNLRDEAKLIRMDMDRYMRRMNSIARVLDGMKGAVDAAQKKSDSLQEEVSFSREIIDSQNIKIQHQLSNIKKNEEILKNNQNELYSAVAAKHKTIEISLAILLVVTAIYFLRIHEKNRRYAYIKTKSTSLAKAKLHNIRNNYTRLMSLSDHGKIDTLKDYVENSGAYFSRVLNKADDTNWTLGMELDLLDRFYSAEKILHMDVEIRKEIDEEKIDVRNTLFSSDILTTLLHNSMRHAFENRRDDCVFTINIKRDKRWLFVTISDNGKSRSIERYLPEDRQDGGLNILRDRVNNEFNHKKWFGSTNNFDVIVGENINGTTIKFRYPYETTIENFNS